MKGRLRSVKIEDRVWQKYVFPSSNFKENLYFKDLISQKIPNENCQFKNINMEICCGKGEYLNYLAGKFPDELFIGLDFSDFAIQRGVKKTEKSGTKNILYLNSDVNDFLAWHTGIKDNDKLKKIWITFPDPWPKKRHHKRRMINPQFLKLISNIMESGGLLFIITDHDNYAHQIKSNLNLLKKIFKPGIKSKLFFKTYVTLNQNIFLKHTPFCETTYYKKAKKEKYHYFVAVKQ